jgi:hypothetical protein
MTDDDPFSTLRVRRRSRGPMILVIGIIAFLAGAAAMAAIGRYYAAWLPWAVARTSVTGSTTASPNTAVQTGAVVPKPNGIDYDTLAAREAALAAQLSALEARTASVDVESTAAAGKATRAEGLLVAFAARRALDRGLGLGYIERQLRERFGATQPRAVATVIQASRAPVTLEDLRLGLESIGPDLVSGGDSDAWWPSLRNTLSNLVVLHKAGSPSPRPSDRLTRARHLIEGGQVEAALAEVARLPGVSKAQRWTLAAKRYIEARRALDVIETAAIIGQAAQPVPVTQDAPTTPVQQPVAAAAPAATAPPEAQPPSPGG